MIEDNKTIAWLVFCSILIGIGLTILMYQAMPYLSNRMDFSNNTLCAHLNNTVLTAYCLNDKLNSFFIYNMSNVGKALTEDQLKEEGGVCSHFARWYRDHLTALGLNAKEVDIDVNKTSGHVIAMVEEEDAYCVLDQTDVWCFPYG